MKPRERSMSAATQVKVLSPENERTMQRVKGYTSLKPVSACTPKVSASKSAADIRTVYSGHARGDRKLQFTSLAHLLDVEYLRGCYYSLNRYKAVGIDNVYWWEYGAELDENLEGLVSRLKRKKYKPIPARRVYIPKNGTEMRPLGISALENKIVEQGITGNTK